MGILEACRTSAEKSLRPTTTKPVWATIRWSGRTDWPSTFHVRNRTSYVLSSPKPPARIASTVCETWGTVGRYAHRTPPGARASVVVPIARPGSGLQHQRSGEDVGVHEDEADVLRIDDLSAALHLEHEVGQGRPEGDEWRSAGGDHTRSLLGADEVVVPYRPEVRVELAIGRERRHVAPAPLVDQQNTVPCLEGPGAHGPRRALI